jgi:hypothetical protein
MDANRTQDDAFMTYTAPYTAPVPLYTAPPCTAYTAPICIGAVYGEGCSTLLPCGPLGLLPQNRPPPPGPRRAWGTRGDKCPPMSPLSPLGRRRTTSFDHLID